MPAEWHPHSGTLMTWPVNRDTWPGFRLKNVEKVYLNIIRRLHEFEPVHLIVHDEGVRARVNDALRTANLPENAVIYHLHASNDVWIRDYGPVFVRDQAGHYAVTDWEYNAWGGKYPPFDSDNRIPGLIADAFRLPHILPDMVLEGGSIDTNGRGVLMTTESVLLNPNRNPRLSKQQIEERLKTYLGQQQIIWLTSGLAGDDTDGHIDDMSRFVSENVMVTALPEDRNDINYPVLRENYEILKSTRNRTGGHYDIIPIPMPRTRIVGTTVDGSPYVPASYANFYIANAVVLLPLYDDRYDRRMMDLFAGLFPGRTIAGIPCKDLVWGQGGIHCITQQMYCR